MGEIITVRKRVSIVRETEKAFLFRLRSGKKKTFWIPKKFCNIFDEYENPLTGHKTFVVDIETWIWLEIKTGQKELNLK